MKKLVVVIVALLSVLAFIVDPIAGLLLFAVLVLGIVHLQRRPPARPA